MTTERKNALAAALDPIPSNDPTIEELEHAVLALSAPVELLGLSLTKDAARVAKREARRHLRLALNFVAAAKRREGLRERLDVKA